MYLRCLFWDVLSCLALSADVLKKVRTTTSTCHRCFSFSVVYQTLVVFVLWFMGLLSNQMLFFDWKWKSWFSLAVLRRNWSAVFAFVCSQLDQIPAFAFPITCLMCPLWEHDICGADSHKSVTSEIKETVLLMSPWLKLLHSVLFASSLSLSTSSFVWKNKPLRGSVTSFAPSGSCLHISIRYDNTMPFVSMAH